jgi:Zn-finger nucleic acid-binding protein
MNCPNCGAAMELSPARGFYRCRYCGTFHFPDSVDDQGVRVVGSPDAPVACATCGASMTLAVLDGCQVHYCERCHGLLIPRPGFAEIVRRCRAWAEGPPITPVPPERRELHVTKNCPTCRTRMTVDRYYGPGNIVMDVCLTCDSVWLDFGEMKQIVDAPGTDRGSRDTSRFPTRVSKPMFTRGACPRVSLNR